MEATLGGQLARIGNLGALRAPNNLASHCEGGLEDKKVTQEQDYNMDSRTTC